jgi:glycosyltransferase involved in cell wall biosynthesis
MAKPDEKAATADLRPALPISVIVAVRNEEKNLPRCLASVADMGEVYVIDSHSMDGTASMARDHGAKVVQFNYSGGWPKKRQWALDTLPLAFDWVLLLDADESLSLELRAEMDKAIRNPHVNGYYLAMQMHFLGRRLRHCGAQFYKLALFRRGKGHYECRLKEQNASMCDMEVHEHVVVDGATQRLKNPVIHHNVETLDRYIRKHNEYSNWEAAVVLKGNPSGELPPMFFGNQAQRRRWLRKQFFNVPGSPAVLFLYRYILRLGFLDGMPGLIYCASQAIQMFHVKAKIYELKTAPE